MRKRIAELLVPFIAIILIILFTLMFHGFLTHSSNRKEINIFIVFFSLLLSIGLNFGFLISYWVVKSDSLMIRIGTSVLMLPMLMMLIAFLHQTSLDFYYMNETGLVKDWLSLIGLLVKFGFILLVLLMHVVQSIRVLNYREPEILHLDIR
jgi:ABC-type dipeptide/oligopeptide/nickel transport system permease subunit